MSSKIDLSKVVSNVQKLYSKDQKTADKLGLGSQLRGITDENFLKMPNWWVQATNTPGLPYGKIVQIAGDSDSGKTSCAIEAMKAAQSQNISILYVETENKTTKEDLSKAGVDPAQVMLVQAGIAEQAFDLMFKVWNEFFEQYPKEKLLLVFDSFGNTVSRHDVELEMNEGSSKPGGKGKTNRTGINKLIASMEGRDVAVLIINYTYDNISSPGKTNAGGKALNFFSVLTYQTSRKGWLEKTVKGEKIRIGAKVQWKLFKNHLKRDDPGPKVVELDITSAGIAFVGGTEE